MHTLLGPVVQSVVSLTADAGVANSILAWSYIFMEIDHEIISTATDSRRVVVSCKQMYKCAQSTRYSFSQACPGKMLIGELTVSTLLQLLIGT